MAHCWRIVQTWSHAVALGPTEMHDAMATDVWKPAPGGRRQWMYGRTKLSPTVSASSRRLERSAIAGGGAYGGDRPVVDDVPGSAAGVADRPCCPGELGSAHGGSARARGACPAWRRRGGARTHDQCLRVL